MPVQPGWRVRGKSRDGQCSMADGDTVAVLDMSELLLEDLGEQYCMKDSCSLLWKCV